MEEIIDDTDPTVTIDIETGIKELTRHTLTEISG